MTYSASPINSASPETDFQSLEDELRGANPRGSAAAHDVPSTVIEDEPEQVQQPHQPIPRSVGPERLTRSPRSPFDIPLFGRIFVPASLLRVAIAFSVLYTGVSITQKFGFVAKPHIPIVAAIAILVTIDQLRYCEFAKRQHFTVLFWAGIISLIVARSQFSVYSGVATVVLYACCRVQSRAPKFLMADCAMGAIATWLFI